MTRANILINTKKKCYVRSKFVLNIIPLLFIIIMSYFILSIIIINPTHFYRLTLLANKKIELTAYG